MKSTDIVTKVKELSLMKGSYIVFGSGPMAALGIREAQDVDLLVSRDVYKSLKSKGWKELDKGLLDKPLVYDCFEAHDSWNFSSYNPTLGDLLKNSFEIDDIDFASLEDVRKWKVASGRPKDLADTELIDKYLEK